MFTWQKKVEFDKIVTIHYSILGIRYPIKILLKETQYLSAMNHTYYIWTMT